MGLDPSASRERLSCLQMFLQSAELRLIGAEARAEIEINCEPFFCASMQNRKYFTWI